MSRRFVVAAIAVLALLSAAPVAAGDGPMPNVSQLGSGVLAANGLTRFVAVPAQNDTLIEQTSVRDGTVLRFGQVSGMWGIPVATYTTDGGEGMSRDGSFLIVGDLSYSFPKPKTTFLVLSTKTLRVVKQIDLKGDFAYDALSPNSRWLYLIQHTDATNMQRYVVRRYDLVGNRLQPGRIADRTQRSWIMEGYPQARATSADGRWVYTLYGNPNGYPFVHALDTMRGVAHCVGLPWDQADTGFYNMTVSLRNHDRTLAVHWQSGRPWLAVNTATWRIAPDRRAGFPWLAVAAGGAAFLAAAAAFIVRRRRRRGAGLEAELSELLRDREGTSLTPVA